MNKHEILSYVESDSEDVAMLEEKRKFKPSLNGDTTSKGNMTINPAGSVLSPIELKKSLHVHRQVFATAASCMLSVTGGMTYGYSGVLLPQLKEDKDFPYDESYDSWIASISPLAMIFGCFLAGPMSDGLGRKKGQLILVPPFILGWLVMGFAKTNAVMLIGRFITGICTGSIRPNSMVYIGEISDPKYRSITLFCPTLAVHTGGLISHIVGSSVYWRTCCFIFGILNIICFILLLFLKESPLWLLSKGRIDEGIDCFKNFRGESPDSEIELISILEKQKDTPEQMSTRDLLKIIFSKAFIKALSAIFVLTAAAQLCGINMISFYVLDIFKRTFSGDIDSYTLMIATDCLKIVVAILICLFAKFFPRKKTFLVCGFSTTLVLIALVIYLYLNPPNLVWLLVTLFVAYFIIASALSTLSWPFIPEIFPSNIRGFGSGLSSGIAFALLFVSVKVTPAIMYTFGETIMYASFGIVTLVTTVLLCFMLPDTDGKTLQNIENNFYKKNIKDSSIVLSSTTL